ncbi:MAG TPA: ATP-binding cassette domain-containing protein [Papillibacter sp.]|jgi:D-methionine transport system ATP-binding protein|nr:ATP-binding cassette domain-containing protein [Papillibacter sp.]
MYYGKRGDDGISTPETIVSLKNLTKTFPTADGAGFTALKDISLDIKRGEIFGIIGMSGAGKSTLVRCINYLERPTSGTVLFQGKDLSQLSMPELYNLRQSIGMIFQQFNLLMQRTALQNVCFPLEIAGVEKKERIRRAEELLELVGLADKRDSYPSQLSGGQCQRVAIARALATNPQVLLCDEATSALDPSTTRGVLALIREINEKLGITVIIITHEMAVIEEICHKVAIIDEGRIAEYGPVSDIFTHPKSDAAKRLVLPQGERTDEFMGGRRCRIVFDGRSAFEPVISNLVLEFRHPINILYANTKEIDGKAVGQMIIALPEDDRLAERMLGSLHTQGLSVEEVTGNV